MHNSVTLATIQNIHHRGSHVPLDTQAQFFLEQVKRANSPPLHSLGAEKAREAYAQRPDYLAPEYVELWRVENRCISIEDQPSIPVRIYTPQEPQQPLPILVFYHGGGMVIGTLDSYDTLCRQLAKQANYIVVSVDYRLAPEHKFPAAVEDAYAALVWAYNNAQTIGGNPDSIVVGGDSAGGNLAAVSAIIARDNQTMSLQAQLLIYPATAPKADSASQLSFAEGYFLERETILWFHNSYIRNDLDRNDYRYAPLIAPSLSQLPPALVIVAGYDPLRDEGAAYAQRLQDSGVEVELSEYSGMFHPFVSLAGVLDEGKRAIEECAAMLRHYAVKK